MEFSQKLVFLNDTSKLTSLFVQELTSLKIWEQMKTIYLQKDKQFSYLYLTCQGTIEEFLKA